MLKVNSETGSEIVTTADVKLYARIDTTADDTLIADMIKQARLWCENYISRDIVAKNRTYYQSDVDGRFILPFSPTASISSLKIDGTVSTAYKTYGLDDKIISLNEVPAREVEVTYITSGINDAIVKQSILQLVATYYDNRSDFVVGKNVQELPTEVKNILAPHKTMFI